MVNLSHSPHDYDFLISRWRDLVDARQWSWEAIHIDEGQEIFAVQNHEAAGGQSGGLYVSAGVHGDECAPIWALLEWAGSADFAGRPVTLFPCLNPTGILGNTRTDVHGADLNRRFQDAGYPVIGAWQRYLEGKRFDLVVNLHEDYDATGVYLYELARSPSIGDRLLSAVEEIIPRETSDSVDGSEFENGLLQRDTTEEEMLRVIEEDLEGGVPEAIWLYLHHSKDSFTFETPSEWSVVDRIAAHVRFLEAIAGPGQGS